MTNKTNTKKFKIEYLLMLLIAISVIGILFFNGNLFKTSKNQETSYRENLQNDLNEILRQISGVGNVNCYITFEGDVEEVFLKNTTTINKNDTVEIVEEVVLVNGKPYSIKNQYPAVRSLTVVCEGGDDIYVKTILTNVLTMALDVPFDKIQIYKMK